jgi:hypothetical protein
MHLDQSAVAVEQDSRWIRPRAAMNTTALAQVALSRVAKARVHQGVRQFSRGTLYANAFCRILLSGSAGDCLKMIAKLEVQGLSYAALVDQLFAPAARELGMKWTNDDLSFAEVSTGISTLLLVNATLRSQTKQVPHGSKKHVLFITL